MVRERYSRSVLTAALIAFSWIVLWLWAQTPHGLHWHQPSMAPTILGSVFPAFLFALGWTFMTVAMMLPTSLPLVGLFEAVVKERESRTKLVGLCVAGYLAIWLVFGFAALLGLYAFSRLASGVNFQTGLLILAGAYQFTPLKYHCLRKCRSPFNFVASHWHGRNETREALALGVHHGLYCIGCCWSLMLLMFLAFRAHTLWMLILGTIMSIEKNVSWGKRISKPIGVALIATGLGLYFLS